MYGTSYAALAHAENALLAASNLVNTHTKSGIVDLPDTASIYACVVEERVLLQALDKAMAKDKEDDGGSSSASALAQQGSSSYASSSAPRVFSLAELQDLVQGAGLTSSKAAAVAARLLNALQPTGGSVSGAVAGKTVLYSGSSALMPRRLTDHQRHDGNLPFHRMLGLLGLRFAEDEVEMVKLETVDLSDLPVHLRRDRLLAAEQKWIDVLRPVANMNRALAGTRRQDRQIVPQRRWVALDPFWDAYAGMSLLRLDDGGA